MITAAVFTPLLRVHAVDAHGQAHRHLLLLWPTLWALLIAGHGRPDPLIVLIFIIGTFLMRSAGCVVNDYADRDFDAHVARTRLRPFARGAVSKKKPCCWPPAWPCCRCC